MSTSHNSEIRIPSNALESQPIFSFAVN